MNDDQKVIWRSGWQLWVMGVVISALMYVIFRDGLHHMVGYWSNREEYSHGFMIPVIAAFLIWQRKDILEKMRFSGAWTGTVIVLIGLALFVLGEFSGIYTIIEYSFIVTLVGSALSYTGWHGFRFILFPLLILIFMVPLPAFIFNNISAQLQLISSEIGVAFIRLFDISVYLEGNVIDLGSYKLQVVEACSGLRYLFPLMTLGFIAAYIYHAAFWKRLVIFLSSIPITVLMNSFRIGVIGVLVEYKGQSMAEGFLHDFEGWVVFMACTGVLILEMWLLTFIGSDRKKLSEVFGLYMPEQTPTHAVKQVRFVPKPVLASSLAITVMVIVSHNLGEREEIIPSRSSFDEFPATIEGWSGKTGKIESSILDALDLSDYLIADYVNTNNDQVNLYVAWYASQRKGESIHSPRTCIPGGGWRIRSLSQKRLEDILLDGRPLTVNRVEIAKGDNLQLVYYWFQGRKRIITNEYAAKWFVFWDGLIRNRTDGALVRLTAFSLPSEDINEVDNRLTSFAKDVSSRLNNYIPN